MAFLGLSFLSTCGGQEQQFTGTLVAPPNETPELTIALIPTMTVPSPSHTAPPSPTPTTEVTVQDTVTELIPQPEETKSEPDSPKEEAATPTPAEVAPEGTIPTDDPQAYLGVLQSYGSIGEVWSLSDLRLGIHPDKVRVVWEVSGNDEGSPFIQVIEVDNATSGFPKGSDSIDPSWGQARIDVMISDCYAYDLALNDILPINGAGNPLVTKVDLHPTFDDATLGFSIGLREPAVYKVFTLTDPVRLVIDIFYEP